jgi:hypothetical protein
MRTFTVDLTKWVKVLAEFSVFWYLTEKQRVLDEVNQEIKCKNPGGFLCSSAAKPNNFCTVPTPATDFNEGMALAPTLLYCKQTF